MPPSSDHGAGVKPVQDIPMRAIVTGAAGFLGGALAARLAGDGRIAEVVGLDRVPPAHPGPRAIVADIAAFDAVAPEAGLVLHAAAITTQASESDPERAYAINVDGMRAVLRWAARQPAPPRLVFLSSLAVFGRGDEAADERTPPDPRTTYGTTKLIAERLLMDATRRGTVDGVILRLPVVIVRNNGLPARPGAGFVSALVDGALRGRPLVMPFPMDFRIPVASSGAVVRLAMRAAFGPPPAHMLHVPALSVSAGDTVAALIRCGVPEVPVSYGPDPAARALLAGWPRRLETCYPSFAAGCADTALDPVIEAHRAWLGERS